MVCFVLVLLLWGWVWAAARDGPQCVMVRFHCSGVPASPRRRAALHETRALQEKRQAKEDSKAKQSGVNALRAHECARHPHSRRTPKESAWKR